MKSKLGKLKSRSFIKRFVIVILIIVIVGGYLYWQTTRDRVFIEDSTINAPVISINAPTSGTLTELDTQEGKTIKKGDAIAVVSGTTLRSQADGLVVTAQNQVGGSVSPQTTIIQMIDPTQLRVVGVIDENKGLDEINVGQAASFTVDAYPGKTFWGYVDQISQMANQTAAAFSISNERPTQRFQVYVRFDATSYPDLKNGMSAKLTIFTKTH
jgi:multidrug resistance efflux pump